MSEDEIFDDLCADDAADSVELENCYVVVKDYAKQAVDELDVFEGQVVCVIDDSDEGKLKTIIGLCGGNRFKLRQNRSPIGVKK